MKNKIYENRNIVIYSKGTFECGDEGDLADEIFVASMMGYTNFAEYLKNPFPFWENVKKEISKTLREVEKQIKDNYDKQTQKSRTSN